MDFIAKTLTYAGTNILAHSTGVQKNTVLDSIIISSNTPPNGTDYANLTINDFGQYKEYPVMNIRNQTNTFQPETVIRNDDYNNDYTINMVGLRGHTDGEDNSTIIAVAISDPNSPVVIPHHTGAPFAIYIDVSVAFSKTDNVVMNVSNAGMVNIQDVNAAISIAINGLESKSDHAADIQRLQDQINNAGNNAQMQQELNAKENISDHQADINGINNALNGKENTSDHQTDINNIDARLGNKENASDHQRDINAANDKISANTAYIKAVEEDKNFKTDANLKYIKAVENDKNLKEYITDHQTDVNNINNSISALKNSSIIYRGHWDGSIADLKDQPDGIYDFSNNTNGPANYPMYGIAIKRHSPTDSLIDAYDNSSNTWHWTGFGGWKQEANAADLVNLQNTVNGQLARQLNLIKQTQNNANITSLANTVGAISGAIIKVPYVGSGQTSISAYYNTGNKTIMFSGQMEFTYANETQYFDLANIVQTLGVNFTTEVADIYADLGSDLGGSLPIHGGFTFGLDPGVTNSWQHVNVNVNTSTGGGGTNGRSLVGGTVSGKITLA